jgi:magnesium transporter
MHVTLFSTGVDQQKYATDLPSLLASESEMFWLDITGPSDEDVRIMRDVLNLHPLAIEDTRNQEQRPKVEEYPGYLFMIINPVDLIPDSDELVFRELDIFVGRNYIVTVHAGDEPVIAAAHKRLSRMDLPEMSVSYLAYILLDIVVDGYFPIMDMVEEEINNLEDSILSRPKQEALNHVFTLKRNLLHLWRVVWPEREILSILTQPHIVQFSDKNAAQYYLRDVADHLYWIADMIGTYRDTLTSVIDLYMSSVSNRLNRVVNRLTVITMGFGVLAVITGFYGMNFEDIWPGFANPRSISFVLLLMGGVVVVVLLVLRRLDDY